MAVAPLSWNDPIFNGVTTSSSITVKNGGTVSYKSITDTGSVASIVGQGSFTLDHVRINSREGVRVGGDGDVVINNSYIETTGVGSDHADGIQAYAPGSNGNITITNSTIVSHNSAATAGLFIADNYGGTVTLNNVVFEGGPYALRIAADNQDVTVAMKDVYFVGPFAYDALYLQEVNADIHITQWENVRYATIVNGELVPGALIPSPFPVEGGASVPPVADLSATISSWSPDSGKTGDGVTNADKITLKGTATAGSTVKVLDGTSQLGTVTADANGNWTFTSNALADGSHKFSATATKTGSASVTSSTVSVVVDTAAPVAPTLAASTSGSGSSASLTTSSLAASSLATAAQVAVLTGTAEANSTIKVFDGTTQIGTATTGSNGAWTFTTSSLSSGSHSFTAKAMDAAGNTGNASSAVSVSVSDTTTPTKPGAPTIATFSQDSGVAGDKITNDSTLTLTGTAAANSTVKVMDGTTQVGTATTNSNGQWSLTTSTLKDGAHSLTATATDASGQSSSASTALAVTVDTKAPIVPTLSVYSQTGASVGSASNLDDFTLKGTAEANSSVKVFDGTKQIGTATANSSGAWSLDVNNLTSGSHSFTATATDVAGNASTASTAKSVSVTAPAASASIDFTGLYDGWSSGSIKGTADPNSQIKLFDGKTAIGTVTSGADGSWSFKTKALSDTVHTFTAQEIDSSGKVVGTSSGQAILGSSKADVLTGTSGDDYLVGNGNNDTFVFTSNFGNDVIKDFDARGWAHDTIEFKSSVFDSFASVLSHASQVGQDVVISHGADTLTLKNVSLSSLDAKDFHFA